MRKIAIAFLILLVAIAILLLPIQSADEEEARPSYTVGVVLKAMDSEHWPGWPCAPACSRRRRSTTSA